MRIAVLSTDTSHHAYYAWRLAEAGLLAGVLLEREVRTPAFDTHHPFEDERDAYERDVLLAGAPAEIDGYAPTTATDSINDPALRRALEGLRPDLTIAFGTGIIGPELMAADTGHLLNLHGGNPEEYRGLDTHLWALYHRDYANLVTTLHTVARELDTGAFVQQGAIALAANSGLHELRARNTELCVELTILAARALEAFGHLPCRAPVRRGRYYSSMPAVLKGVCVERFREHVATL